MSGFFKKVASAFVEVEETPGDQEAGSGGGENAGSLDEITQGTAELMAQLEGMRGGDTAQTAAASPSAAVPAGLPATSRLQMTAERVFAEAQIPDGANSAERILKLIGGLAMFPAEQQVVMIRAMDTADETWAEDLVMDDARNRQAALRRHVQSMEDERESRSAQLNGQIEQVKTGGRAVVDEIDRRIAELQQKRETAVVDTAGQVADLQHQQQELEATAAGARRGITHVINALSQLITFFTGGQTTQGTGGQS
jgi:hypothetical protein